MLKSKVENPKQVGDFSFNRIVFDLSSGLVATHEELPVRDDMDFLGGIGRSFKILAEYDVTDPFAPDSPLVVNVGCLTGTAFMKGIESIYGVPMTPDRLLDATYRSHLLGFALEQKQGTTLADYSMPDEIFVGERKGALPGVSFLTRELFEEIRDRVLERLRTDAVRFGYGRYMDAS